MSPHTLRHTFATHLLAGRLRPARGAGDARPRRHRHDADLHAPLGRAPEGRLLRGAPARSVRLAPVRARLWRRTGAIVRRAPDLRSSPPSLLAGCGNERTPAPDARRERRAEGLPVRAARRGGARSARRELAHRPANRRCSAIVAVGEAGRGLALPAHRAAAGDARGARRGAQGAARDDQGARSRRSSSTRRGRAHARARRDRAARHRTKMGAPAPGALGARVRRRRRGRGRRLRAARGVLPRRPGVFGPVDRLAEATAPKPRSRLSRRAFVVVLDACGVGALPDAADYGDAGANTLGPPRRGRGRPASCPCSSAWAWARSCRSRAWRPRAAPAVHGRLAAAGAGKDSTAGHWELMGASRRRAAADVPGRLSGCARAARSSAATGRALLCNRAYNGVEAIERYGARAAAQRRADRLHVAGLRAADRRATWTVSPRRSCTRSAPRRAR